MFMVPNLIDSTQHTAAAGVLLARLAEASREGPQAERELRLPVLSALGCLHIDPAVAERVLHTALEVLSCILLADRAVSTLPFLVTAVKALVLGEHEHTTTSRFRRAAVALRT